LLPQVLSKACLSIIIAAAFSYLRKCSMVWVVGDVAGLVELQKDSDGD